MGSESKSGATASMLRGGVKGNVVSLREASVVMNGGIIAGDEGLPHLDTPRRFPHCFELAAHAADDSG